LSETEPVPAPPSAAVDLFGPELGRASDFASLLATRGIERGLLGPREVPRMWERHLLNCAVVAGLVPASADVVDIGSGAGLPGLVIAMLRPGARMTLLEPMLRRTTFLEECVAELGLGNVVVCRGRAEDVAGKLAADVATARAVAPLDRLAKLAAGLVKPGGTVLAVKGRDAQAELDHARPILRRLGMRSAEVLTVGQGIVEPPATVVRILAEGDGRHFQPAVKTRAFRAIRSPGVPR
jgi:16S rRNA (guanine527-N7)-methyltransferase